MSSKAKLFIVTGPSGVGKNTLMERAFAEIPDLKAAVSHTTRAPRPGERDGVEYHYVSHDQFTELVAEDAFLEWAEVFGNRYGITLKETEHWTQQGTHVLVDLDWQGAAAAAERLDNVVRIFIVPPSLEVLEERLRGRAASDTDDIEHRLAQAASDLEHSSHADHVVVNHEIDEAGSELVALMRRYA